jgi:hypothetical protein
MMANWRAFTAMCDCSLLDFAIEHGFASDMRGLLSLVGLGHIKINGYWTLAQTVSIGDIVEVLR